VAANHPDPLFNAGRVGGKIKRKSGQRFVLTPDKSGLCQSKTGNDFFLEQRRRSAINSTLMDNNP